MILQSIRTAYTCRCIHAPVLQGNVLLHNTSPGCAKKHNDPCICFWAVRTASPAGCGMAQACMAWLRIPIVYNNASSGRIAVLDKHDKQLPQYAAYVCQEALAGAPHHQNLKKKFPHYLLTKEYLRGMLTTNKKGPMVSFQLSGNQHQAVCQSEVWLRRARPICLQFCNSATQALPHCSRHIHSFTP